MDEYDGYPLGTALKLGFTKVFSGVDGKVAVLLGWGGGRLVIPGVRGKD